MYNMKNIITFLFLLIISCSYGQIAGVRAGFNMSYLESSNKQIQPEFKAGYYAGVLVEIGVLENKIYLQPEVIYSRQGSQFKGEVFTQGVTLNYINTPLLLKFKPWSFLSIQAGPKIGFLINKPYLEAKDGSYKVSKKDFSSVDFGVVGGVSLYTPSGFFVEARYSMGLNSVLDKNISLYGNNIQLKNSVISLGAGFLF